MADSEEEARLNSFRKVVACLLRLGFNLNGEMIDRHEQLTDLALKAEAQKKPPGNGAANWGRFAAVYWQAHRAALRSPR